MHWRLALIVFLGIMPGFEVLAEPNRVCPGSPAIVEPLEGRTLQRHSQWGLHWSFELPDPPAETAGVSGAVTWAADTLGFNSSKDVAIARCPGDFDVASSCRGTGWDGRIRFWNARVPPTEGVEADAWCRLDPARRYYLNIRDYDCPNREICSLNVTFDQLGLGTEAAPDPVAVTKVTGGVSAASAGLGSCALSADLLITERVLDSVTGEIKGLSDPSGGREGFISGQTHAYRLQTLAANEALGVITLSASDDLDHGASDLAISTCPGDFASPAIPPDCRVSGSSSRLPFRVSRQPLRGTCTLEPHTVYFVNVGNACAPGDLCGYRLRVDTGYRGGDRGLSDKTAIGDSSDDSKAPSVGTNAFDPVPGASRVAGTTSSGLDAQRLERATLRAPTPAAGTTEITTPTILAETSAAALSCANWRVIGACFWLRCTVTGCSVRVSVKVGHYNPDLVVAAYNELGGNPWVEMRATLGSLQKAAAGGLLGSLLDVPIDSAGNLTEGADQAIHARKNHQNTLYRETDAIGHPAALDALAGLGYGYFCPAASTTPLVPYFQSALDALAWRTEIPEALFPASWIPGLREVGDWPLQTWGSVYPRTGWSTQSEEPKAAALNAQRAGDIVTRDYQPHIYRPVKIRQTDTPVEENTMLTWLPPPLIENDGRTGLWQMLMPLPEASCAAFGENDLSTLNGWGGGRVSEGGDYAWNLWRPYTCCRVRGTYLFSIETPYP